MMAEDDYEVVDDGGDDADDDDEPCGRGGRSRDQVPVPVFSGTAWRDFSRRVEA